MYASRPAVAQPGRAHRLAEARARSRRRSSGTVSASIAAECAQPPHVPVEQERLAVVGAQRLVDAFAVQEPVIEDRDRPRAPRSKTRPLTLTIALMTSSVPRVQLSRCRVTDSRATLPIDARAERRADARSRSPDDRGDRHPVARADGERRPPGRRGHRSASTATCSSGSVAVLCGRGNNGGDGFVVARTLLQRGVDVSVFLIGRVADVRGDARINLEILGRLGLTVVEIADSQAWELHFSEISDCTLIVDAIFGTGLNAPLSGLHRDRRRRRQRVGHPDRRRSICRRACRPIRTSRSATRSRPA